ncbi:MAG TPA: extensin family protein [Kofleriaceae bacterium]|nr:extensin family protein [Kofleriaceae bacterium]
MLRALALVTFTAAWILAPPVAAADDIGSYPLDAISREVPAHGKVKCPKVEMVRYRGDIIRFARPVRVYVGFAARLRKFEEVVRDVAIEVYGRAPRRIRHIGTYNCRRIRTWPTYLSEHALGNGIDIEGFDFGPARGKEQRHSAPQRRLRRGFHVRIGHDWNATRGVSRIHAEFLRRLTDELSRRQDIFRVILGPGYPGHKNHFHFDCSPWRAIELSPARTAY